MWYNFGNLSVSLPFALKYYFADMRTEGVAFLIYFVIIAACGGIFVEATSASLALL
ncbi:MAG: hypothetical protein J6D21_09990 [Clostridia bacterium]|nr:hypothetical protein [Clostridia bacterium]